MFRISLTLLIIDEYIGVLRLEMPPTHKYVG
jgi:hypothetical protein